MPIRKNDFIFHAGYYVPIERIAFVMQPGGTAERHIRVLRPSNGIEGRVFLFTNSTPESEWKTCLSHAEKIGLGSRDYELVVIK